MTAIDLANVAPALTTALVEFLWQGAAIAALLWIVLSLLRSANARYLAASGAMMLLAFSPMVTFWRSYARPVSGGLVFPAAAARIAGIAAASTAPWWAGRNWVLDAWALGVLLFSVRLIRSAGQVHYMRRAGEAAEPSIVSLAAAMAERIGVTRAIRVLVSTMADVPSVVGWLRPAILLPASALAGLTPEQLETVLAHEIAHIRRHDYAINLLQVLIETVLFYHPAVWWVSSQMRKERELCCDDMVVATCGDAAGYARVLTTLERQRSASPALALGSTGGALSFRVKRLVGQTPAERTAPPRLAAIAATALAVACFALSFNWTRVKAQSDLLVPSADGIEVDSNGAELIHRTRVEYPEALRHKKIGGVVTVVATLDEHGMVSDARVVSGPAELRKPALASVLNWHFMPAASGATRDVTITFTPPTDNQLAVTRLNQNSVVGAFLQDEVSAAETQLTLVQREAPSLRKPGELALARANVDQLREKLAAARLSEPLMATALMDENGTARAFAFRVLREQTDRLAESQANPGMPSVIYRVEAGGLSDKVTKELLSRVPAHAGDMLTPEKLEAIRDAVHQFDEHFEVAVEPVPAQGDSVVIVRIDLRE